MDSGSSVQTQMAELKRVVEDLRSELVTEQKERKEEETKLKQEATKLKLEVEDEKKKTRQLEERSNQLQSELEAVKETTDDTADWIMSGV